MKNQTEVINYKKLVFATIKDKLSYFILGAVIVLGLSLFLLVKFMTSQKIVVKINSEQNSKAVVAAKTEVKTYVVKEGDTLWKISENSYGSGYNAYDIAKANRLSDANIISTNQTLIIPSVTPKETTAGEVAAAATTAPVTLRKDTYTVQKGDFLWDIALRAYGDGYMWTKIANANNITNPDYIFSGNVLKLPR